MREFFFWAFVLLSLPACTSFSSSPPPPPSSTTPDPGVNPVYGVDPRSGLVLCDIETLGGRRCPVSDTEIANGISLDEAALALNEGRSAPYALDYSAAAREKCPAPGGGRPQIVPFQGGFPNGTAVCANCADVLGFGKKYADANGICQAKCWDFYGKDSPHCAVAARAGTNAFAAPALATGCFATNPTPPPDFMCSATGALEFHLDPRRLAEAVRWQDAQGVQGTGAQFNNLTRTAETTGEWDAGAVSAQWIRRGDGYVEFTAARNHQLGLTQIEPPDCPHPCTDTNYGISGIGYALDIGADRRVFIFKKGAVVDGVGTSNDGDRFRIYVKSNHDDTATIRFVQVEGTCIDGQPCNLRQLGAEITGARYPLRVDASIQDKGTTIGNVRMVYLH